MIPPKFPGRPAPILPALLVIISMSIGSVLGAAAWAVARLIG